MGNHNDYKHNTYNMSFDFKDYKKHTLTRPRDEAWDNWKSWKDAKVGDKVEGFVADAFYRPEEKDSETGNVAFRPQRGITVRKEDGTLINVGVKYYDFILAATDNLRVGDPIIIEFEKQNAPAKKGQNGAKVFKYYGTNLPENEGNKTVKELTDEDKNSGGSTGEEEEKSEVDEAFEEITSESEDQPF